MKVISILQPWATLVVLGLKKIETRSWDTKHRGEILIHASKGKNKEGRELFEKYQELILNNKDLPYFNFEDLPFGKILGKVDLVNTFSTETLNYFDAAIFDHLNPERRWEFDEREKDFGDYSPNRYGWLLENPFVFETPIAAKGKLGIWNRDFENEIFEQFLTSVKNEQK